MRTHQILALATIGLLAGCNQPQQADGNRPAIKVTGPEQQRLHTLDAINLAIGLKRAIYDAGYTCKRITDAGYVGEYQNLDMWTAHCTEGNDWAIFAGADGSAQVRDCKDIPGSGLPTCVIKKRPKGSFSELK